MVVFPNAKINLGLNILSKRDDGYHNISSVFYPIPFWDILEIIRADQFKFDASGLPIPGDPGSNLIIKAYETLKVDFDLPPVHIHLHKIIPMGAGVGGGSSDAAFTIKTLNGIFSLGLSDHAMEEYAGKIGSDCPFFIRNKPVLAEGTGTEFSQVSIDLSGKWLMLICPDIHVSTVEAYSQVVPAHPNRSLKDTIELKPHTDWRENVKNDFEDSVFSQYPVLQEIKQLMYKAGAIYASMSGSGSSIYGIFDSQPETQHLPQAFKTYISQL